MLLGGKGVGKTTLLQMVRQEGKVSMKNGKDNVYLFYLKYAEACNTKS
jgi:predicted ATPase